MKGFYQRHIIVWRIMSFIRGPVNRIDPIKVVGIAEVAWIAFLATMLFFMLVTTLYSASLSTSLAIFNAFVSGWWFYEIEGECTLARENIKEVSERNLEYLTALKGDDDEDVL